MAATATRMRPAVRSRLLALSIPANLAVVGLAMLAASALSYRFVAGAIMGSGQAEDELRRGATSLAHNFGGILTRLRYWSATFLVAAALTAVWRNKVQSWIEEAVLPLPRFVRDQAGRVGCGLKADGFLHAGVLLALTVMGVILRVPYLSGPMRTDEAETFLSYASRPLYIGLSWYPAPNNHLFHTFFVHLSWLLFGEREWVIRLPALVAGIVLIPFTYWAGRMLYDKHAAIIAAALVAPASTLIAYSTDGRGYTMLCAFFLLLLIAGCYLLKHDSQPAWLLWAVAAALGAYTIPTMLYAAAAGALWIALACVRMPAEQRRQALTHLATALVVAGALTALLYMPVAIASGMGALTSNSWVQPRSFAYLFAHLPVSIARTWDLWTIDVPPPLVWLLTAGFVVGAVLYRRIPGHGAGVLLAAGLSIPPLVLAQRVVPYSRVWLFLLPLTAAVCGAGLWFLVQRLARADAAPRNRLSAVIALCCFLVMCLPDLRGSRLAFRTNDNKVENMAAWIQNHVGPDDLVVAKGAGWSPLTYYFRRNRAPLINRPAPCDPMSIVYTLKGSAPHPPGAPRHVLTVGTFRDDPTAVLSASCLVATPSSPPELVYDREGMQVHQGYFPATK